MPPKDKETLTSEGTTYSMDDWIPSDGLQNIGTVDSLDPGVGTSYSFGELNNQLSFDFEEDLRKKYPALQDALEHYQNVKQMCETREKEEDEN